MQSTLEHNTHITPVSPIRKLSTPRLRPIVEGGRMNSKELLQPEDSFMCVTDLAQEDSSYFTTAKTTPRSRPTILQTPRSNTMKRDVMTSPGDVRRQQRTWIGKLVNIFES
jgi:hypothetical protein